MRTEMDDFTGESKKLMKSAAFIISGRQDMSLMDKLGILADAAKYDVACTSSGVDRKGTGDSIGNCVAAGICHSFSSDGRCISLDRKSVV